MLKIQIHSKSTKQMENVIKKLSTVPNRIQAAQTHAMNKSAVEIDKRIKKISKASKYLQYSVVPYGKLGVRMTISLPSESNERAYYAALVLLKGRKNFTVTPQSKMVMKLREESVQQGYPEFLMYAKIPAKQSKSAEIRREARDVIIENMEAALKKYGFGPRGGLSGLKDIKPPRARKRSR